MNALASGATSFVALLAMALWVGGTQKFMSIVSDFIHLFLVISFFAIVLGASLSASRIRWSVIVGTLSGIVGGCVIILWVMSGI
jgi:hypothetical protein